MQAQQLSPSALPIFVLLICLPLPLHLPLACSKTRHRFWFENPQVSRPIREDAGSMAAGGDQRLFPRECREAVSEHSDSDGGSTGGDGRGRAGGRGRGTCPMAASPAAAWLLCTVAGAVAALA